MLGSTLLLAGDRTEAIRLFERGLAAAEEAGVEAGVLHCAAPLAAATGSRGVLDQAAGMLAAASIPDHGAWMLGEEAYLSLARAWLARGEPERARAVLAPAAGRRAAGAVDRARSRPRSPLTGARLIKLAAAHRRPRS